ncbi:MAG: phthiocerol/phthiodiolone dimycocerosyl transferase family protein [Chloroflexota bacterium]
MQRPLSPLEQAFCLSEPPVPMNFVMVACFRDELDEATLRQVLHCLRARYPMGALRLDSDAHGGLCFTAAGVAAFPLSVSEQAYPMTWQQVAAQELGTDFDLATGPLARAVLLKHGASRRADLILTFHHGIADGMSGVYFLRDLLGLLHDAQANLPDVPPLPDLHSLISPLARPSPALQAQVLGMKSGLWLMRHFPPFGRRFPPADRLIEGRFPWQCFGVTARSLTQPQTARLATRCREKGTSVHAAVCAAWLRARLESGLEAGIWKRAVSCPVNLRGFLNAENTFGVCMSNAVVVADCRPGRDFWDIACQVKARINCEIQTGRVYHWALMMGELARSSPGDVRWALPAFATQPVRYDFSISNLGRLCLPTAGTSPVLEAVYGPVVNTSEREMTVGVSTACERLTMTLAYRDFVLDPMQAEKMATKAVDILAEAVGG